MNTLRLKVLFFKITYSILVHVFHYFPPNPHEVKPVFESFQIFFCSCWKWTWAALVLHLNWRMKIIQKNRNLHLLIYRWINIALYTTLWTTRGNFCPWYTIFFFIGTWHNCKKIVRNSFRPKFDRHLSTKTNRKKSLCVLKN